MIRSLLNKKEFGDFQTPLNLAVEISKLVKSLDINPKSVLEPSCGTGTFLKAALNQFNDIVSLYGLDVNEDYIEKASESVSEFKDKLSIKIEVGDFFLTDWTKKVKNYPKPILVIGNLPWVTIAALSTINGSNAPVKTNQRGLKGIDIITGKSNFDISEWMLMRLFDAANATEATLAFICKTSVARKLLKYAKLKALNLINAYIFKINAKEHFNVAVNASVFICTFMSNNNSYDCKVFNDLNINSYIATIGFRNGILLADAEKFDNYRDLLGKSQYIWRSGVKHDASKILELSQSNGVLKNKLGENVDVEDNYIYPLVKGSDLANDRWQSAGKSIIITQQNLNESTDFLQVKAPKLWKYLKDHEDFFKQRASRIYKNKSEFAMFGVGNYTFSGWKIAIAALYKKLEFRLISPLSRKPVIFDDTCYFIPFSNHDDAEQFWRVLNSNVVQEFLSSFIFWDEKRPITAEILNRLDVHIAERQLNKSCLKPIYSQIEKDF